MRFGLMSFPVNRRGVEDDARLAADAGFDLLATGDHLRHPRDPTVALLDGWSVLAAWAMATTTLDLAMLVSNLIYRHPTLVAKQAITVDQLSGGRLELGVGAGVYGTDHAMSAVTVWTPHERVARLREFVGALDAALRGEESYAGEFYAYREASWSPGPLQHPRPPIAIGAVGPKMLHLTAEMADVWSAFGGITVDDESAFFGAVANQIHTLDRYCEELGRDPASLRRSLLAFRPLAPWQSPQSFESLIETVAGLGFDELVLYRPATVDEMRVFEQVVEILPTLKQPARPPPTPKH